MSFFKRLSIVFAFVLLLGFILSFSCLASFNDPGSWEPFAFYYVYRSSAPSCILTVSFLPELTGSYFPYYSPLDSSGHVVSEKYGDTVFCEAGKLAKLTVIADGPFPYGLAVGVGGAAVLLNYQFSISSVNALSSYGDSLLYSAYFNSNNYSNNGFTGYLSSSVDSSRSYAVYAGSSPAVINGVSSGVGFSVDFNGMS